MSNPSIMMRRFRKRDRGRARNRVRLEWLEPRELLSTFTVSNTNDDANQGSLRWAIGQVNGDATADIIKFAISGAGAHTIKLGSSLPQITNAVLIDGTSQSGYSGTPLISIDGSSLSAADYILWDAAASSTIQGLAIAGCPGVGVLVTGGGNDLIQGCYIGTADGTNAKANGVGIEIFGAANNTIGGTTASARNVISGNTNQAIAIGDAFETDKNLVAGNYIGINASGTGALGNGQGGLLLDHAAQSTISGNVISGNTGDGILIQQVNGTSTTNLITNDLIGTNSAGTAAIPNTLNGIHLNGVTGTTITGGLISGNGESGILLDVGTTITTIKSSNIGTNLAGTLPVPNGQDGIQAISASGITIGGAVKGLGNLISGNQGNGINLAAAFTEPNDTGVLIQGNIIGLVAGGTSTLQNGNNGIWQNGSDGTTIGGTSPPARNIISGNSGAGISLGTGNNSLVEGNYIGTDVTGKMALGNSTGIELTGASYATIGGTAKPLGNLISGNTHAGIDSFVIGSTAELIEANLVGVDVTGTHALPNVGNGIRIAGPTNCTIGGTVQGAANVISANASDGIALTVGPANGLLVLGNYIGTDSAGDDLGNMGNGVTIWSDDVTIGGTTQGAGNVIAYNANDGITLVFDVHHNSFLSNSIHDNGRLGIDLGGGPTANHLNEQGFTIPAPNDYQNYPVVTSAAFTATSTEVIGTLNAAANTAYLVQFFASASADTLGYGEGQKYLGSKTVTTGPDFNTSFDAVLNTGTPAGWVISATATDPLGNTSEFSQDIIPVPSADVAVQVTASPSPTAYAGVDLTYTVTVTDSGSEDATGVIVTDTLPQNIGSSVMASTSVAGVTTSIVGNVVTAVFGTLSANTFATLTITVVPTAGAVPQVIDQASVTSTTSDPNPGNNTATLMTPVGPAADLSLTLGGSPGTVIVGNTVTYLLTVKNNGPSNAADAEVSDALPLNITSNVMASTSIPGVSPVIGGGQVTADLGPLASGASATVTITVVPDSAAVPQITDSASISGSTFDPDPTNNAPAAVTTTVQPVPVSNLSIAMSGTPDPVGAGSELSYTIQATNSGPSPDPNAVITDTLPANVTFVSASGGATPSNSGVLTLPLGNLAAHDSSTVTVIVVPTSAAAGAGSATITNSAVITGTYNGNLANSASATTTVTAVTAIGLQVHAAPTEAQNGQNLTFTVTATNNGPSNATGLSLTDTLPADITSNVIATTSVPGVTANVSDGMVSASFGELDLNDSVTLTITVVPTLASVSDSPLVDSVTVTSNEFNPNPKTAMSSVPVAPVSDLSITMSGDHDSVGVGSNLTYTIKATNSGPSADSAAVVTDTLPANVILVMATGGATPSGGVLTLPLGSLAANASKTVTIVVTPTAAAAGTGTGTITNSATISSPSNDNLENSASVDTSVTAVTAVGLQMTGTPGPNYIGQDLKYTIVATNHGPSNATGVVVTDTLPTDITTNVTAITSVPGVTASVANRKVTASFGNLNINGSVTLTITVVPTESAVSDSPLVNTATVANNEFNSSSNMAMLSTPILPMANLAITQFTASPDPVEFAAELTYTAVVTNNGPSPATSVKLDLPFASTVSFVSGSWVSQSGSPGVSGPVNQVGSDLIADIGNLAVGATATVTIVVTPKQSAIGQLTATATATSHEFNGAASQANATVTSAVVDRPGTLQFSASSYQVAENAGYAAIDVVRTDGLRGQVSVNFTTVPMSATAGLDYTPTAQTIVFPAGVAKETIQVPVLADPYDDHDETVGLALAAPAGDAVLGSVINATLTIKDIDPNTNVPTVTAVQWTGSAKLITSLVLSFSEPLAAATATNPNNFAIGLVGRQGTFSSQGQKQALEAPVYDPVSWTVTLVPARPLSSNLFYSLVLKGTAGGITDIGGNPLAGAGASHPGTDFSALLAQGTHLTYMDAGANKVIFGLQHGGYLEDLLTASGQGQRLVLVGEIPHHSILSGTVKQGKHGTGRSYLGYSVYGLGQFGNVRVTMKSPPFVIQRYPFSPGLPIGPPPKLPQVRSNGAVQAVRRARAIENAVTMARPQVPAVAEVATNAAPANGVRVGVLHPRRRPFAALSEVAKRIARS
jgi:uncharacterized repeat protein (TIGR01451 family)